MNTAEPQEQTRQQPAQRSWWRQARVFHSPETVFLEHLPLIERVAAFAGRRAGFPPQDVEDFLSTVKLKLIADDYAVLRQHRGESSISTFLTTVIHNQLKDFRNHMLGKFRPSAEAKRLGPLALALERLVVRDQLDLETAIESLCRTHPTEATPAALRRLAARLPQRSLRRFVGEEALEQRAANSLETDAEARVAAAERSAAAERVGQVLKVALETLSAQDLLILKMFFQGGCTIAAIASALHLEQRPLYTRKDNCLKKLRTALELRGWTWEQVREILEWGDAEIGSENPWGGSVQSLEGSSREEGP